MYSAWLIVILVLLVVAAFFVPRVFMRRALREVVDRFYEREATSAKSARTLQQLDLVPPNSLERMYRRRDYRPQALGLLVKAGIVIQTESGSFYLSVDALKRSNLRNLATKD
jgi:hypothetical protein